MPEYKLKLQLIQNIGFTEYLFKIYAQKRYKIMKKLGKNLFIFFNL